MTIQYQIMHNIQMGNAVLMPEFYGLGIHKLPSQNTADLSKKSSESVEVRKLCFRSTYEDDSESSIFSHSKNNSTYLQSVVKRDSKPSETILKTQQSFADGKLDDDFSFRKEDNKYKSMEFHTTPQFQQKSADDDDPFSQSAPGNISIINKILQIQETQAQKQAIREKCKILFQLGENQWRKGDFKRCVVYLEEVLRESGAKYPENKEQKAKMYSYLGSSYLRMSIYDKAADFYHKSLKILQQSPQSNISRCASVHLTLGTIYQQTENINQAIEHFDSSVRLRKSQLSKNAPELLSSLRNLAQLQIKRGNHMKAIQRFTQILAINRSLYGSSHIEIARTFYYMALSLFKVTEYSMWLQYHYESIRMMKDLRLQKNPEYLTWLKMFKSKLIELVNIQHYAKDIVERSMHMALLLLDEDQQIDFLEKIKGNLEGSIASDRKERN